MSPLLPLQILMGISLAACAGLRAWLPLLCVGLLARLGYVPLGESFQFLARTDLLIVFGVASILEVLGDKIPVVDNFLDTVGTWARPVAGTLLAASAVTGADPAMATVFGLILGGGTALTIHAGKAATRVGATATAPAHGGAGNVALSLGEDALTLGGIGLAVWIPVVAFVATVGAVIGSVWIVRRVVRSGKRLLRRAPLGAKPEDLTPP